MVHSSLVTRFALTSDYSSRSGVRVDSIGHHHAAGTSLETALSLFQPGGRTVSPNYCIKGKEIVLVVPEEYRAWTSASAQDDARSITYEIVNTTGSPSWGFDDDTLDSVIRLDADIANRYGIQRRHALPGFWEHRNLYEWFGRSYATACAGPSFNIDYIIDRTILAGSGATPIREIKVQHIHKEDRRTTVLAPGENILSKNAAGAPQHILGDGLGPYSITPHVYADGEPGDALDLTLEWASGSPAVFSPHYAERLVADGNGVIRATREFKRALATGQTVVLRVTAPLTNRKPITVTVLDSDAYLFTVA